MKIILHDKIAILHVFAGLIKSPELIGNTKEFKLSTEDFPERFHQIIYGAIYNLFSNGVERISAIEIDKLLREFPSQYHVFNEANGLDYLFKVEEIGQPENFFLHYSTVKKFSFLRACRACGIDISDIYDPQIVDIKESELQQESFNNMTLNEMVSHIEGKLISLKDEYLFDSAGRGSHMAENLREIIAEKMKSPSYGANLNSGLYTAATRGARLKKVYMVSAPSGTGKSRFSLASMLSICVPEIWSSEEKKWVKTGATGKCLFITTELEEDEVKIPALCYIADVPEDRLQSATLTDEEQERIHKAIGILEETPFWFEELHDFDLEDVEHTIVKNVNKNNISYISYDYIHTSMKIFSSMSKAGAKGLQEHQILLQMSIRLKEIANKYNVFLATATQLNSTYKEGEMDDGSLSGAKAIAQKVDMGALLLDISTKDEEIISSVMHSGVAVPFGLKPNLSLNIYKNRGNKWKKVRIWIHFNHSTLRTTDVFSTDYKGVLIPNLKPLKVLFDEEEDDEITDILPSGAEIDTLPSSFSF